MNRIILKRQKHNEPEFGELYRMLADLKAFFNEDADFKNSQWIENLNVIADFQDDDGSFKLFDSYRIPTDARVDFCYMPTYLCTAILMKAYLANPNAFAFNDELQKGLKMCCIRNLRGHGFEALKGQIEALNIFFNAGLREFIDLEGDFCPEFSEMIDGIIAKFREMEEQNNFLGPWKESYEAEIRQINEYFNHRNVFVYGTLMGGEANNGYLENSSLISKTTVRGYDMYDVGWYPAIVPGDGLVIGEIYRVPTEDMSAIDALEGEGSLYMKKCETVTDGEGKTAFAFVYVYLNDVTSCEKIPAWNEEYVWYVSYGSNMLRERFMRYIKGGSYEGSRPLPPCEDTTPPIAVKSFDVPYCMYFGEDSPFWGGGVSFIDVAKKGKALGIAYLVSKDQFRHIVTQENGNHYPDDGHGWYANIIGLGIMDGFEVKTVTKTIRHEYSEPSQRYLDTLAKGIKENWPEMSDGEIGDYLNSCIRKI